MDGRHALGVVGEFCMDLGIQKAKVCGEDEYVPRLPITLEHVNDTHPDGSMIQHFNEELRYNESTNGFTLSTFFKRFKITLRYRG